MKASGLKGTPLPFFSPTYLKYVYLEQTGNVRSKYTDGVFSQGDLTGETSMTFLLKGVFHFDLYPVKNKSFVF